MARRMELSDDEAYRVTLVHEYPDGSHRSETYGPFLTIAPARAKVTRAKNKEEERVHQGYTWRRLIAAQIQKAHVTWEDVE